MKENKFQFKEQFWLGKSTQWNFNFQLRSCPLTTSRALSIKAKGVTDDVTKQSSLLFKVFPPAVNNHLRFGERESNLALHIDHQVLCLVENLLLL